MQRGPKDAHAARNGTAFKKTLQCTTHSKQPPGRPAMFGSSKSRAFKPVPFGQSYRRRKGVPKWLLWLVAGMAVGSAGFYYAEKELMPPRLSFIESQSLKSDADKANKARDEMATKLADATSKMKQAQAEKLEATNKMNTALARVDPLKKDLELFLKTLPPDPRGNAVAVRAGLFSSSAGKLNYHVLFTRDKAGSDVFKGALRLVVSGNRGGKEVSIDLPSQDISIEGYQHANGALDLPDGFQAREVSVKLFRGSALESLRVFRL